MRSVKIGRPTNPARDVALATGRQTYLGSRCHRCGGRERFVQNWTCVICQLGFHVEQQAVRRSTVLALYFPEEFDRLGRRQRPAARGAE